MQERENAAALQRYQDNTEKARRAHIRAARVRAARDGKPPPSEEEAGAGFKPGLPPEPETRIHAEETEISLLLGSMMKIYFAFRLTDASIDRAQDLTQRYLLLYKQVCRWFLHRGYTECLLDLWDLRDEAKHALHRAHGDTSTRLRSAARNMGVCVRAP